MMRKETGTKVPRSTARYAANVTCVLGGWGVCVDVFGGGNEFACWGASVGALVGSGCVRTHLQRDGRGRDGRHDLVCSSHRRRGGVEMNEKNVSQPVNPFNTQTIKQNTPPKTHRRRRRGRPARRGRGRPRWRAGPASWSWRPCGPRRRLLAARAWRRARRRARPVCVGKGGVGGWVSGLVDGFG